MAVIAALSATLNIPATFGALTAAEVGIKKGADALLARVTAPVVLP